MRTNSWGLLMTASALLVGALVWMIATLPDPAGPATGGPPTETTASGAQHADSETTDAVLSRRAVAATDAAAANATVRVLGRVVDAYGEPLRNAMVGEADDARPTRTTRDGGFELAVPDDGDAITLLVLAAGHAPHASTHEVLGTVVDAGDLELLRGGGIRGRVTDVSRDPIAGASVTVRFTSRGALPASVDPADLVAPATTDADGDYAFAHMVAGTYRISVDAPGLLAGQATGINVQDGGDTVVDPIVLTAGHALAGVVLGPDDVAVPGASVRIRGGRQPRYDGQVDTSADGRFAFDSLPEGRLRIEVTKPGFRGYRQADVDATSGEQLVVRLDRGLRVTGTAVDAATGRPVERFAASIRRIGDVDPSSNGRMEQQLERQLETLSDAVARATDAELRDRSLRIWSELTARLERVRQDAGSRPVAAPVDPGPVSARPGGEFEFGGLEEGLYAVRIASPDHQFAELGPVELREGVAMPELRVELVEGRTLSGVVVGRRDGSGIGSATVQLVRVVEVSALAEESERELYPWVFAHRGPKGVTVMVARTAADGSFEFRNAAPGRCFLSVRDARIADHDSAVFDVGAGRQTIRLEVGARATLTGRVVDVTPGAAVHAEVLVLGGHGTMLTTKVRRDGSYRFDGLQPGSYLVRAFPADEDQYVRRLLGSIFPLHAGAVEPDTIPVRDVTLAEGETRTFDLALDRPPTGVVEGLVAINGGPPPRGRAMLRPVPGEAPGSGGMSLRADVGERGRFTIRDVPVGNYTLIVSGPTRQELHSESITVEPEANEFVQVEINAGGLRGRVRAPDGASPDELDGYAWVLPGASEAPADVYEYRRSARTHRIRVRNGVFEDAALTPGPAIVVVDMRGRRRVATEVVVPARETREIELLSGARLD